MSNWPVRPPTLSAQLSKTMSTDFTARPPAPPCNTCSFAENDLSVHSSRTPIGKYFERGTKTPIPDGDEHNLDFEDRDVGGEGRSG